MNFITGKQMPRRTFLRGVGATVALPFLDSMVSAGRNGAHAAAADEIIRVARFLFGPFCSSNCKNRDLFQ